MLEAIWQRLGIGDILRTQAGKRFGFDIERALFAMVANRACAPASKLYCHEQWLKEDVRIAGTGELSLQHLYRAMDFLEANKEAIEQAIFYRVADLLNLDVEVIFYDTTSLHFEIDEEDQGASGTGTVRGSQAAGGKEYQAPRKRGHSKNGRTDAPQVVIGLAVTREGFPVRHWVFPGNTVDVTTVAKVKEDLKGWQLTSARYGRLLKGTRKGLVIDMAEVRELERFDGKFVVHSNDDTLTAEDMALGYKQLQRVEESWRSMKSGLRMRPVFHWAPHRIHAHIAISVLALLLERTIEHACEDTWRNIRDDLKHIQLAQLLSPNGTVWQVTEPTASAAKRLKLLKIKPPAPILGLA